MGNSKHGTVKKRKHIPRSEEHDSSFSSLIIFGGIGAIVSFSCAFVLSLISSALCMLSPDPSSLTLYIGLGVLYISSFAGGIVAAGKLQRDRGDAIISGLLCGFTVTVLFGLISTALSFITTDFSHGIKLLPSILLKFICIPMSALGSYVFVSVKGMRPKRRK